MKALTPIFRTLSERLARYRKNAEEAEHQAAHATTLDDRDGWLKLAEGWRCLIATTEGKNVMSREPDKTEDDIQREQLGPRGVPGGEDQAKKTPQQEKNTPKNPEPPHTV